MGGRSSSFGKKSGGAKLDLPELEGSEKQLTKKTMPAIT